MIKPELAERAEFIGMRYEQGEEVRCAHCGKSEIEKEGKVKECGGCVGGRRTG